MKNIFTTVLFLLLAGGYTVFAQTIDPIPSYYVPVSSQQAFEESGNTIDPPSINRKRTVAVKSTVSGPSCAVSPIQVYIYHRNGHIYQGPYNLFPGQTLFIPVTGPGCGVLVRTKIYTLISVWMINAPVTPPSPYGDLLNEESENPWADSIVDALCYS